MIDNKAGTCQLTGQKCVFVKSHIVPKAILNLKRESGRAPLKIFSLVKPSHPKRSQTGLYDQTIVGANGEKILAKLDDGAVKLLKAPIARESYVRDENGFILRDEIGKPSYYLIGGEHYPEIKLLVLSVFWRASLSRVEAVAAFKLPDAIEERKRQMIVSNTPGNSEEFGAWITRFRDVHGVPLISPVNMRLSGVPYVMVTFGQFQCHMKVSHDQTPTPFDEAQMIEKRIPILLGNFHDTNFGKDVGEKFRKFYNAIRN